MSRAMWIFASIAVLLVALTLYSLAEEQSVSELAKSAAIPTTYSPMPGGCKAVFAMLDKLERHPQRLRVPWTELPAAARVVICLCPTEPDIDDKEWDAMWAWVRAGGFLVYGPRASFPAEGSDKWQNMSALQQNDLTEHAPHLAVSLKLQQGPEPVGGVWRQAVPLYGKRTVAATVEWGQGGAIVFSHPELWTNDGVTRGDNLQFLLNVLASRAAGPGTVYFDEFHHGYGQHGGTVSVWKQLPLAVHLAVWQIVAAALLLGWALSRRLAAPRLVLPPPHERSEYLESMAALLDKAHASRLVARRRSQALVTRVALKLGLGNGADFDQVKAALVAHDTALAQELQEVVVALTQLSAAPTPVPEADLLSLAEREGRLLTQLGRLS